MEILLQDLRYAARTLLKRPAFTSITVITLALGIGANTAIFSVINGVLLKSLPLPEAERLVVLNESSQEVPLMSVAFPNYLDWKASQMVFDELAAWMPSGGIVTGGGEPERVIGRWVTASFFTTLGVTPRLGRFFDEQEDNPAAERVMVIGHGLWQRRFGGDPSIVGKSITYNREAWTVVGVIPAGFDFYGPTNVNNDFFAPLGRLGSQPYMADRHSHLVFPIARLKPGVTLEQARYQLKAIAAQLEERYPVSNTGNSVVIRSLLDDYVGDSRPALLAISSAVALVLLIACVNVANLLLARAAGRRKEMAVRIAVGAARWRIVRLLMTESVLLAAAGGVAGLLLAAWGVYLLVTLAPDSLPRPEEISIDPSVLGFSLLITLITGLIFGLVPALQTSKVDLTDALKDSARQSSGSEGRALRGALVVSEVALSLVLLVGAGLLVRSFRELMRVDPGFDASNVLTMRLRLPDAKYREASETTGFLKEVKRRVQELPGVREASVATGFPLGPGSENGYWIEGQPEPRKPADWPVAVMQSVSEEYHRSLGIGLIAGRYFTDRDNETSAQVVIVDEDFARRHFPDDSARALGSRLRFGGSGESWREVVGVVRHVRHMSLDDEGRPAVYRPWLQITPRWLAEFTRAMDLIVKTDAAPESFVTAIKQEVQAVDSDQPLGNVRTLGSLLDRSIAPRRLSLSLFSIFAAVAMLLGAIGLYGVVSYSASRRTREIGIRVALGARRSHVLRLIIRQGMSLSLIGVGIGLAVSYATTRLMTGLLYRTSPTDPGTFAWISLLLVVVALAACYLPARRAAKVEPMVALREG